MAKRTLNLLSLAGKTIKILGPDDVILATDYLYEPFYDVETSWGPGFHSDKGTAYITKDRLTGWIDSTLREYSKFAKEKPDFIVFRIIE